MAAIGFTNISKTFGGTPVLTDLTLSVADREFMVLVGPSGCGKSTALRLIAGLEALSSGTLTIGGRDVAAIAPKDRDVAMVFQSYALFNHMTVFENIAFGLRVAPRSQRLAERAIRERVDSLLETIQLPGLGSRFPVQLSGGQRQRVAFARALAVEPSVLLLDEPFGALDAKVRRELRTWLAEFHRKTHLTSLFVTHDQEEAFDVADRVVLIDRGKIQQVGTPEEIRSGAGNTFVRDFLAIDI